MKRFSLLSIALVSLASFPAVAQDVTAYPCFQCSNEQMSSVARSYGDGTQYVYDLYSQVLGFNVQGSTATAFTPDQFVQDQFWALRTLFIESNGTMSIEMTVDIPESQAGIAAPVLPPAFRQQRNVSTMAGESSVNAYDVLRSSQARNLIDKRLKENPRVSFTATAASMGRAIKFEHLNSGNAKLSVSVSFPDGSRVVFIFNYDTKNWEYANGTAVDSNNNSIPETPDGFVNGEAGYAEYGFQNGLGSDASDFIHRANMMGITVTGQRGSGRTGIACTKVNNTISCRLVSM